MKKFFTILLALVAAVCCFSIFVIFVASGEDLARTLLSAAILGPIAILCGVAIGHITGPDFGVKKVKPTHRLRNT